MFWVVAGGMGFVVVLVAVISLIALLGGTSDSGDSGWKDVITRLEDSDSSREEADLVLRSGPKAVIRALEGITELDGDGVAISENACTALASLGSEIVGPLTAALHSDSPKARAGAVRVLREMGATAKGAASDLGNCLDDNQRAIRLTAADALINLGADAAPAVDRLAAVLSHSDSETRRKAAQALAKIGPGAKSAISALNLAARTDPPDYPTQQAALAALKLLDPQGASAHVLDNASEEVKELFQSIASSENPADERAAALKNLAGKGHEAAILIPAVYKILRHDTDKSIRLAAAEALGHFGAEAYYIVPGLEAIAAGPDSEVAAAARAAAESIRPRKQ
jgi:HEAT repeat protein